MLFFKDQLYCELYGVSGNTVERKRKLEKNDNVYLTETCVFIKSILLTLKPILL